MDPSIPVTTNTRELQKELLKHGYEMVPHGNPIDPKDLQKGDVILGFRPGQMPSHAAIYNGNGKLIENDSNTGTIIDNGDVNKFNQGMHRPDGSWNKNGFSDTVILRKNQ